MSDGALTWMVANLQAQGVTFRTDPLPIPDPAGVAHKPWRHGPWVALPQGPRTFPAGLSQDASIAARQAAGPVLADPGEAPAPYQPGNLP